MVVGADPAPVARVSHLHPLVTPVGFERTRNAATKLRFEVKRTAARFTTFRLL
jgi:hypothetical protein